MVEGVNRAADLLVRLLWGNGDRHVTVDYQFYDKAGDELTKNDHFRAMVDTARVRGFQPHGGPSMPGQSGAVTAASIASR